MKKVLATALLSTVIASTAVADNWFVDEPIMNGISVEVLLDADVYSTSKVTTIDSAIVSEDTLDNWEHIGEVEDLYLDEEGKVIGVILEVGGLLDIGDEHVAMTWDNITVYRDKDDENEYHVSVKQTLDQLKKMPSYKYND